MKITLAIMALLLSSSAPAGEAFAGIVNAPNFPRGLEWLNTDHPVSLRELRGKIVLLDFWTFCCINCMHVIPDLKRLEAKYRNELVVIGVHSAKFTAEQGTQNIRDAVLRYGIEHPVLNDQDFEVWNAYTVHAWPTFVLINPDGKIVANHSGEGVYAALDPTIGSLVKHYSGKINRTPRRWTLEKEHAPLSFLAFPGKVASDRAGRRLFVTDANHNRIVMVSLPDGNVLDVAGDGAEGLRDGSFQDARFNRPQGIAADGDTLYVADTENHVIRRISLVDRRVETIVGTGHQAGGMNKSGTGRTVPLNSPWDLLVMGRTLYVAMAGAHQIWSFDLDTHVVRPFAGSGREAIIDGARGGAALAQPSGITTDGAFLYVADSEGSAVRRIGLGPEGEVATLVGEGLFEFGDKDGTGSAVRLQHPIGITWHGGTLYVADTYNNKVKALDPASRTVRSLVGTGRSGMDDGVGAAGELNEPNGVCFAGDTMYIADTNNHLLRRFDLKTGTLTTLQLRGGERLMEAMNKGEKKFGGELISVPEQSVSVGDGAIEVSVHVPKGYKINNVAPFYIGYRSSDTGVVRLLPKMHEQNITNPAFPISIPATFGLGRTSVEVDLVVYFCEERKESLCLIKQLNVRVPIAVNRSDGRTSLDVAVDVKVGG